MNRYSTRHRRSRGPGTPRWAHHHLYDLDYERRLLGGLLTDPDGARKATSSLTAEDFMLPEHTILFEAIRVLEADGVVPSGDQVAELLGDRGFLSAVPGITQSLEDYIPSADESRLPLFAERIRQLAALRSFLRLAGCADSFLRDRHLDQGSRIKAAYEAIRETA